MLKPKEQALLWQERGRLSLRAAQVLVAAKEWYGTANRAYYAAYQAATSLCVLHGDSSQFPNGWGNPSHEQLPDLIKNNGDLTLEARQQVVKHLRFLRALRVNADYRAGNSVNGATALQAVQIALLVFEKLGVEPSNAGNKGDKL